MSTPISDETRRRFRRFGYRPYTVQVETSGGGACGCQNTDKSELEKVIAERPIIAIFAAFALGWLLKGRK